MTAASASFPALGTTATVCVADGGSLEAARDAVECELCEVDRACSRFRPDSDLSRLNAAAGRPASVGPLLLDAIRVALGAAAATDGLVDPTIGATLRHAGYDRTFEVVRRRDGPSFRARFAPVPGWREVEVDADARTVRIPPGCELDLGATAKALAADRAARAASAAVAGGVLVSLGGDLAVAGSAPPGGWAVGLADDHRAAPSEAATTVAVRSGGVATSSTVARRWRAGEFELHHIVDPRTGRPAATPWRTATVAAASCVDANVASTAALVLGPGAPEWLSRLRLPARLVDVEGVATLVAGWPEATP